MPEMSQELLYALALPVVLNFYKTMKNVVIIKFL